MSSYNISKCSKYNQGSRSYVWFTNRFPKKNQKWSEILAIFQNVENILKFHQIKPKKYCIFNILNIYPNLEPFFYFLGTPCGQIYIEYWTLIVPIERSCCILSSCPQLIIDTLRRGYPVLNWSRSGLWLNKMVSEDQIQRRCHKV